MAQKKKRENKRNRQSALYNKLREGTGNSVVLTRNKKGKKIKLKRQLNTNQQIKDPVADQRNDG